MRLLYLVLTTLVGSLLFLLILYLLGSVRKDSIVKMFKFSEEEQKNDLKISKHQSSFIAEENPQVDIVIINYNGFKLTSKCLKDLLKDDYPNKTIVVVDNGSNDDSVQEIKRAFPEIELIENKNNDGYARGNNIAIKRALKKGGDFVLILNNDVFVKKGFLKKLVERAKSSSSVGITTPKILKTDKKTIDAVGARTDFKRGRFSGIGSGKIDKGQYDRSKEVEIVAGSCMLIKREVFEKIGLIPEDYFFYYEETDFCMRVRKEGFKIVVEPSSVVCHVGGGSSNPETSVFSRYYSIRNSFIFMSKYAPRILWYKFFIMRVGHAVWRSILLFGAAVIKGEKQRRKNLIKAYFWGIIDFIRGRRGKAKYKWLTY